MNYDEDLVMNNHNHNNPNINTKYIKSLNYPQNSINIGKINLRKQKIKVEKNINPEIFEFQSNENYYNMPRPIQNLEPYIKKETIKVNQIFENMEPNVECLMPKHSIKPSNSSKINTKINNKKYMNKNKFNDLDNFDHNDILYKNKSNNNISKNNFNIPGQNSGKIITKKITNFNSNNTYDLKMAKSSIQINGKILPKKNSFNKVQNTYNPKIYQNSLQSDKNINFNYKIKPKKEFNLKSNYLIKELKTNKINNNKDEDSMEFDNYQEMNFIQPENEYNNIFFYNSPNNNNINDINETYTRYRNNNINNNINKRINSTKEKGKNNLIYKKIKKINKKEPIKANNITIKKKEIKNKLKNNYEMVDFVLKLPYKEEKISMNIKEDNNNIKEKLENIINDNELNNSYLEPVLSLVNNSINILKNVDNIKITKIRKFNKINIEELNDEMNYSLILDLRDKNKCHELIEDIYPDFDDNSENNKILNMSI